MAKKEETETQKKREEELKKRKEEEAKQAELAAVEKNKEAEKLAKIQAEQKDRATTELKRQEEAKKETEERERKQKEAMQSRAVTELKRQEEIRQKRDQARQIAEDHGGASTSQAKIGQNDSNHPHIQTEYVKNSNQEEIVPPAPTAGEINSLPSLRTFKSDVEKISQRQEISPDEVKKVAKKYPWLK